MRLRNWHLALLVGGIALLFTAQATAQQVRPTPLRANPYRDGGGSCVYDRDGMLVHKPKGKVCQDRTDHSEGLGIEVPASLIEGFPPALQADLRQLLGDHTHISEELTRLRQTIQSGEREEALGFADRIEVEVAEHRRREEEFLLKLSNQRKGR